VCDGSQGTFELSVALEEVFQAGDAVLGESAVDLLGEAQERLRLPDRLLHLHTRLPGTVHLCAQVMVPRSKERWKRRSGCPKVPAASHPGATWLLLRGGAESRRGGRKVGVPKRIVVAIDFSKLSHEALDYAVELAGEVGAKLHVVYVVEPVEFSGVDVLGGAPIATQALVDQHLRQARKEMERLKAKRLAGVRDVRASVQLGRPAEVIVAAGGRGRGNLIIVGTHGRSGLAHLVMGSVAERVVRHAECPVLVVPRRGKRGAR
jgi:universal stress protein A